MARRGAPNVDKSWRGGAPDTEELMKKRCTDRRRGRQSVGDGARGHAGSTRVHGRPGGGRSLA